MTLSATTDQEACDTAGLRASIRLPLGGTLLLLAALTLLGFYRYGQEVIDRKVMVQAGNVERLFRQNWQRDAELFRDQIDFLQRDPQIRAAFAARDRTELLSRTEAWWVDLRAKFRVTHFYFHLPDKTNFLRVQHPQRYGDRVERFTLNQAAETGADAAGLELGTFGSFTLRVVHPWRVNGELLGYIELGEEIEHLTPWLKQTLGVELVLVLEKKFTTRSGWEEGQRMFNRHESWDESPHYVVIDRTEHVWMPELESFLLAADAGEARQPSFDVQSGQRLFRVRQLPLTDASQRQVGHILVLVDMAEAQASLGRSLAYLAGIILLVGGLVMVLFWVYVGRVQARFDQYLQRQATLAQDCQHREQQLLEQQELLIREKQLYQRVTVEEQTLGMLLRLALEPTRLEVFLRTALERLFASLPWIQQMPEGAVFLVDQEDGGGLLRLAASHNFAPDLQRRCAQVPFGSCLCGRAAASREPLFAAGVDERHETHFDGMAAHGHYVIPLLRGDRLIGVYTLYITDGTARNDRDEVFLQRVGEVLALGIEQRRNPAPVAARAPWEATP